eukprot:3005958-Rhodomonas_salina.1
MSLSGTSCSKHHKCCSSTALQERCDLWPDALEYISLGAILREDMVKPRARFDFALDCLSNARFVRDRAELQLAEGLSPNLVV